MIIDNTIGKWWFLHFRLRIY